MRYLTIGDPSNCTYLKSNKPNTVVKRGIMLTQGINHYPADLSVNKYPVPFTRWRFVQQIALSTLPTTKFWAMMGAYVY